MNTLPFNSSSTGMPAGVWPWNSPPVSEKSCEICPQGLAMPTTRLPAAGMTTIRSKQIGGKSRNGNIPHDEFQLRQDVYKGRGQEKVASKARVEPSAYQDAAGQTSGRILTSIHQNLHDLGTQMQRNGPDPKTAVDERRRRFAQGETGDRADSVLLGIEQIAIDDGRKKGDGYFGLQKERTDPITHFKYDGARFDKWAWWRKTKRLGYSDKARGQTWTWQRHIGYRKGQDDDYDGWHAEGHVHDTGDLVTCRGERIYNLCGAEDMLPAGVAAYIKCDMPPSKAQVIRNDKKCWPPCARIECPRGPDYNGSGEVWAMFRNGAWCEDSIEAARKAEEKEARIKEELKRAQSARPVLQGQGSRRFSEEECPFDMQHLGRRAQPKCPITGETLELDESATSMPLGSAADMRGLTPHSAGPRHLHERHPYARADLDFGPQSQESTPAARRRPSAEPPEDSRRPSRDPQGRRPSVEPPEGSRKPSRDAQGRRLSREPSEASRRPSTDLQALMRPAEDVMFTDRPKTSAEKPQWDDTQSFADSEGSASRARRRKGYRTPPRRSSGAGSVSGRNDSPRHRNAVTAVAFDRGWDTGSVISEDFRPEPSLQRQNSAPSIASSVPSSTMDRRPRGATVTLKREGSGASLRGRKSSTGGEPFVPRCAMSRSNSVPSVRSAASRRSPSVAELSDCRWR